MFVNRCTKLKVQKAAIFQYTSLSLQTVPPPSRKKMTLENCSKTKHREKDMYMEIVVHVAE